MSEWGLFWLVAALVLVAVGFSVALGSPLPGVLAGAVSIAVGRSRRRPVGDRT